MTNRPTSEQEEKLRPYVSSGFLAVVQELAKKMTAPFWWYDPAVSAEGRVVGGGTMCFVETGGRLLGITAGHIHTACVRARKETPRLACQIGAHSFDPLRCLIDLDEELDLAVYGLSEIQAAAAGTDIHRPPSWPPQIDPGVPFLVCGWPWHLARSDGSQTDHSFLHFIAKLSDHSDRNLVVVISPSTSVPWGTKSLPAGTNLGGMSGGPVYQLNERGLTILTLVGIIYEYHSGLEFVRARPVSLINKLGYLGRGY